jgi:hypothetical protein
LLLRDAGHLSLRALRALLDLDAKTKPWRYQHVDSYLRFIRLAREMTALGGAVQLFWSNPALDAQAWIQEFRTALDKRINLKAGSPPRWRRLDPDYQAELRRDQLAYQRHILHRVRLRSVQTDIARKRLGHLIHDDE